MISSGKEFPAVENPFLSKDHLSGSSMDRCEYLSLRLGTELVDTFNAPGLDVKWNERLYQDFLVKNLGFAPWMADGIHGKTSSGQSARDLHTAGGWINTPIHKSPYHQLEHKWVYMNGDSTTRQIWASFGAPFKGNNFERNAKEYTRHYCNRQPHRKAHPKGGFFPEEGWGGPCGTNEVTCHISGYGDKGVLSFDWKHFPYDDYDEYLWGVNGPWISGFPGEGVRRPDLLTVQFGLHSCWHASPQGFYSKHLEGVFNTSMYEKHTTDIWKLMGAIRQAIDHPPRDRLPRNHTTVIIVTSGSVGLEENSHEIDYCIHKMNLITAEAARAYGFAVLDRGDIEKRLLSKSFLAPHRRFIIETHLVQPAQNIIATTLLHLYSCLENENISRSQDGLAESDRRQYPIMLQQGRDEGIGGRPLHSPPG
eukprot:gene5123-5629_t